MFQDSMVLFTAAMFTKEPMPAMTRVTESRSGSTLDNNSSNKMIPFSPSTSLLKWWKLEVTKNGGFVCGRNKSSTQFWYLKHTPGLRVLLILNVSFVHQASSLSFFLSLIFLCLFCLKLVKVTADPLVEMCRLAFFESKHPEFHRQLAVNFSYIDPQKRTNLHSFIPWFTFAISSIG